MQRKLPSQRSDWEQLWNTGRIGLHPETTTDEGLRGPFAPAGPHRCSSLTCLHIHSHQICWQQPKFRIHTALFIKHASERVCVCVHLGLSCQHIVPEGGGPGTGQLTDIRDDNNRQGDGLQQTCKQQNIRTHKINEHFTMSNSIMLTISRDFKSSENVSAPCSPGPTATASVNTVWMCVVVLPRAWCWAQTGWGAAQTRSWANEAPQWQSGDPACTKLLSALTKAALVRSDLLLCRLITSFVRFPATFCSLSCCEKRESF